MGGRALSLLLVELIVLQSSALPVHAQAPAPAKLNIVILEGEGAINNIRRRVTRESIVQVQDENHRPVAGAAVMFFLPDSGASGVFTNGSRSLTMTTDQSGKAVARGIRPNQLSGDMQIRVTASYKGLTANAVIHQKSVAAAAAAGAISGKVLALIIVGVAAGVTAGALVATRGNGGGGPPLPTVVPPTAITPGAPTVGAPR